MEPDQLRKADAIEVVVGQGAKPGGGGMLLGQKISDRVAEMRTLPKGIDQRSACRHPDWTGPDDLEIKIQELREITDWEKPIYVKVGAARPYYDTALAVKSGADVVVLDGMQGGTAATQDVFIEHVGIPTLAAIRPAVQALQELDMHRKVQLIVSGGIRSGADVAKALALGADAVSIGTAALIALGDNHPRWEADYNEARHHGRLLRRLARGPRPRRHHHAGPGARRPASIRSLAGKRLANYLSVLTLECADHRARLRQEPRAQSRARGSRGADGGGRRDGRRAARRHQLDSGEERPSEQPNDGHLARGIRGCVRTGSEDWGSNDERPISRASPKKNGVKYFLISFVDLFGTMRAKIVPATAIDMISKSGAGFAGFATWLDMTPAHPDMLVMPDPETAIQLPWKPEVAWVTGDLVMDGKLVSQGPRQVLKRLIVETAAKDGYEMKTGVECEYLPDLRRTARRSPTAPIRSPSPATTSRR